MRLEDDGAQEVLCVPVRLLQPELGHSSDVLPQRLPLLVLLPDVRALEEGDQEVLGKIEELQGRPLEGLHSDILPCGGLYG